MVTFLLKRNKIQKVEPRVQQRATENHFEETALIKKPVIWAWWDFRKVMEY